MLPLKMAGNEHTRGRIYLGLGKLNLAIPFVFTFVPLTKWTAPVPRWLHGIFAVPWRHRSWPPSLLAVPFCGRTTTLTCGRLAIPGTRPIDFEGGRHLIANLRAKTAHPSTTTVTHARGPPDRMTRGYRLASRRYRAANAMPPPAMEPKNQASPDRSDRSTIVTFG